MSAIAEGAAPVRRRRKAGLLRTALRMWRTRVGVLVTAVLVGLAVFGPRLAPFGPADFVGRPFQTGSGDLRFGADGLGQDVWSRFLYGGRSILIVSVLATILGVGLGVAVGLTAAYARNWLDDVLMRVMDILLAFPQIMLTLIAMATVGPKPWLVVLTVGVTTMPRVARVMRGSAVSVVERDFIASAEALGEGRVRILVQEILPNVTGPLVVETTLRLTYAIGLIAAIAFLGFTNDPNAADWGKMVQENSVALLLNPWAAMLPALAIGLLTIGTGLIGDGLARASSGIDREGRLMADAPALVVRDLRIDVSATGNDIVDQVSFEIGRGEVLGLVGESGSGKTTAGLAILGHTRRGARIAGGSITIGDLDMLRVGEETRRRARGRVVSYVPQDPSASLNPALRIGTQLIEVLEVHNVGADAEARRARVAETMREVLLPDDEAFLRRYPHQLSGGQQQRVGIAMAFACRPQVIVLDEPTTGLDVSTQSHVLDTVREITKAHGAAALYVTHDLAVVANLADRVAVMYAGRLVEEGPTDELFRDAAHPYTRRLLAAIPHIEVKRTLVGIGGRAPSPGSRPIGCAFAPRCDLAQDACSAGFPPLVELTPAHRSRCLRIDVVRAMPPIVGAEIVDPVAETPVPVLSVRGVSISYGATQVVHDIDLELAQRECLAIVGESGSGKTTLARTIAGLHRERTGEILLDGKALEPSARGRPKDVRRRIQYVFQNPYGSLNPRRTIGESVSRPLALLGMGGREAEGKVGEMLERVSLTAAYAGRYPDQLSGGERQRVAIARALICDPEILVCDEVTSALDVSVQAAIVDLLAGLQRDLGLAMLFVTHNLPLVRSIAQRVAVMQHGRLVEVGTVDGVLSSPTAEYTQRLLSDTPQIELART